MKRYASILVCMCMSVMLCYAQETPQKKQDSSARKFMFGVGVGFTPSTLESRAIFGSLDNNTFSEVALPLSVILLFDFENFRLEPELGINSQSTNNSGGGSSDRSSTISSFKIGAGVLGKSEITPSALMLYGVRFGYLSVGSSSDGGGSTTSTSSSRPFITVAIALGGEYFIGRQLSIGTEVNLGYMNIGKVSRTPSSSSSSESTGTGIFTNALLLGRFYFGK